jgi:hypothetical protein
MRLPKHRKKVLTAKCYRLYRTISFVTSDLYMFTKHWGILIHLCNFTIILHCCRNSYKHYAAVFFCSATQLLLDMVRNYPRPSIQYLEFLRVSCKGLSPVSITDTNITIWDINWPTFDRLVWKKCHWGLPLLPALQNTTTVTLRTPGVNIIIQYKMLKLCTPVTQNTKLILSLWSWSSSK